MQENPFTVRGAIKNPRNFIGRKAEINHILMRLKTLQSCSVVGERRIGKSSLLYHLFQTGNERLHDDSFRFVYIELLDARTQTAVDFLQTVLAELNLSADVISDENKPNRNLVAFDREICLLTEQGIQVVLCLDEFEGLFANPQEFNDGFFNHLRSMVNGRRLAFVAGSRKPLEVYAVQEKLTSPFFNLLSIQELGEFTGKDVEQFLAIHQETANFTDDELEFIAWYHEPHPIKLQIFCDLVIQRRDHECIHVDMLKKISEVYGQFLGGKHDWKKWEKAGNLFSAEGVAKWLGNVKNARDLVVGK